MPGAGSDRFVIAGSNERTTRPLMASSSIAWSSIRSPEASITPVRTIPADVAVVTSPTRLRVSMLTDPPAPRAAATALGGTTSSSSISVSWRAIVSAARKPRLSREASPVRLVKGTTAIRLGSRVDGGLRPAPGRPPAQEHPPDGDRGEDDEDDRRAHLRQRELLPGCDSGPGSRGRHDRRDSAVADALEAVGEIGRRLEARLGAFLETAVDRALEIHRHRGAGGGELRRFFLEDVGDDLDPGLAAEGAVAGGHLVDARNRGRRCPTGCRPACP